MKRVYGIDVDGVLSRFEGNYLKLLSDIQGHSPLNAADILAFRPKAWHWEGSLGFTPDTVNQAWEFIERSANFWAAMPPMPGVGEFLTALNRSGHDIYFVTARPGFSAKGQTERWIEAFGMSNPTVLLASNKGLAAALLGFDAYIDDRLENCRAVQITSGCNVYMPRTGYNRIQIAGDEKITEVDNMLEMLDAEAIPYDAPRATLAQAA